MSQHDPSPQPEAAAASAASSPLAARRRPSDSLGGWSVEISAVAAAAPLPSSSRARSGTISYDTAAAAEHSIRPSLGLVSDLPRQYLPTSNSHSNLPSPLLPTSTSQLPPASNASSPASGIFKFAGRKKKHQLQLQSQQNPSFIALPGAPHPTDALVSPALVSSSRNTIIDNSMNAISTDSQPPPGHVVQAPAKSQCTASIFRRPKTADTERRLFSQPQPKIPANAAPRESASGSQTTDQTRSSRREGRRLLVSKSASSTALKDQYKKQDANAPVPAMPYQQSSYIPHSPRNSSSGKRRDFVPTSGLDFPRDGDSSSRPGTGTASGSTVQSTFSRLMSFASRSSPLVSPLPGLPGAPPSNTASSFGLVPVPSRSNPNLATDPSPNQSYSGSRSRLNSFGSGINIAPGMAADPDAQPPSPTATRAAGPSAPYPPSSSRWVESGVLETLYDAQDDRTPMGPSSWASLSLVNSPLPSPSISATESQTESQTGPIGNHAAMRSGTHTTSTPPIHSRRQSSTPRHSTTEFPSMHLSNKTDSHQRPDGLPPSPPFDRSPSSATHGQGTEANARSYVTPTPSREKRYPPRTGEGSFMRKRFGSSSSIGLGLGILSSSSSTTATGGGGGGGGGNRGNAGASSPDVRSLAGTPRTSFSASFAGGGTVAEGMGGRSSVSGSGPASPDSYQAGAGRHTSDVGASSASKQAAAFAADIVVPPGGIGAVGGGGVGGGGGPGKGMGSRKTSLGSSGAPSRLAAAGGAAALFGSGNAGGGGMGSFVLGNTRQRTSSLFASLSNPFRSAGESSGSKEVTSPTTSPMARHLPLATKVGPPPSGTGTAVAGSARVSLDRPSSRNWALSAVELDRFGTLARTERSASGSRPPASGRATPSSAAGGVEATEDLVLSHHPRHQRVSQPAPVVESSLRPATAASAAADAIKTRDTEAMEDVRYFLLGENKTNDSTATSRRVLYHSKSEEKFGSMRLRRSRSSSDLSSQSNRARSQSRTRAGDVKGAPRKESVGGQSSAVGGKRGRIRPGLVTSDSTSSLPVSGGRTGAVAPGDTSELSDASSSLPLPSLGEVNPAARTKNGQEEAELSNAMAEIDAWADVEAPKLLAFLAKTMSRGEVVKFLSSASTLMYPFGSKRNAEARATVADANNGSGGGGGAGPTPAPLEPALATAVRRTALKVHMRRFAFGSDPLDIALRKLLMEIKLPSETQQIDRVMEAFARRYMECNEGLYASEDQPYILAFSLMMLHTDAFNRNAKHKMTKADYVKNTAAGGVPTEILEYFYDNTTFTQFIHIDEETDTAVAALPTGGPPPTVSSSAGGVSQMASRSASSGSLAGPGQAAAALLMSSANNSDVVLSLIGTGGNSATASFGSLIAGGGMLTPNLVGGPGGSMSSSGILVNGPGGKMKIDPYLLIRQGNLSDFRPSLDHLIPPETPYQYTGTDGRLDIGRLRRTFIHAPLLEIVQSRRPSGGPGYQPVWNSNEMMSGAPSVIDHYEAVATIKISKAGILLRKDDIPLAPPIGAAGGDPSKAAKKARGKKWKKWGLVLSGSQALFFKDSVWTAALESQMEEQVGEWWADPDLFPRSVSDFDEDAQSLPSHLVAPVNSILRKRSVKIAPRVSYFKPDSVVPLSDAIAVRDESYAAEGDWVFRLWFRHPAPPGSTIGVRTEADGTVWESRHFLLQAATEQEMNDWISLINYSAAYRSVGDRKIDAQELAKLLCEASPASSAPSGPGPAQAEGAAGLNRASSTLRRHGSISGQIQVISSSTSNVFYSGSRNNSVTAEEPGGYMCSPQVTLQTFVTHAQAAYDDCAKQLEDELRVARHFAMLTPFLRTTRERIETAAIPVAEKVRERRLQVAKYAARLDVLRGDLEHVDDVAPSAMVFMPAPRSATGPILGDLGMPRVSMSEGLRMEASASSNELRRSDSASIKRVDSTPPQLDIDIMGGGGFDSRLDLFDSDRSGPRSSASHGSFALPSRRSEDPIELGDHPTGKHGMEASDIMEELTPTIGSNGEEYDLSGSASSSASALIPEYIAMQLERHAAMQQQQQGQQPLRSPLANSSAMYEQAEDWNKTAAGRRVSLALLPDSFESSSSPRKARTPTNGGGGAMALSANGPSNSGSGGGGPLSAINSALGAMKRKASISRP